MGYSIQDINTRLAVVEDKLDFLMSAGMVTKRSPSMLDPRGYTEQTMTMLDLYRELKTQGLDTTLKVLDSPSADESIA